MQRFFYLLILIVSALTAGAQEDRKVIIDADTGNEVDDLYAIVRALIEPSWDVVALNATQWQPAHWAVEQTMEESYRLNQLLLGYLKMNGAVASHRGAENRLFDWGYRAQHSAAAYYLIEEAHKASATEKLTVIALGALTNVASAIIIDPTIIPKISLYWLGTTVDFDKGVQRQRDFNCMMDRQALDEVLESEIEMHIIPVSVASQMTMEFDLTKDQIGGLHGVCDFILDRWYQHLDGGRHERTIWDLAIIMAVIDPTMVTTVEFELDARYDHRTVTYYRDIDADRMRQDFYETIRTYFAR